MEDNIDWRQADKLAQELSNKQRQELGKNKKLPETQIRADLQANFAHFFEGYQPQKEQADEPQLGTSFLETQLQDVASELREPVKAMVKLKFTNLVAALREERRLTIGETESEYEEIEEKGKRLKKKIEGSTKIKPGTEGIETLKLLKREGLRILAREKLSAAQRESIIQGIQRIDEQREAKQKELAELRQSNPEAFLGLGLKELKEYKRQADTGSIVEFPSVQQTMETITNDLETRGACFLIGETGLGKTEAMIHTARKLGREHALKAGEDPDSREPIVVRAHSRMKVQELFGHQALVSEGINPATEDGFNKVMESFETKLQQAIEHEKSQGRELSEKRQEELRNQVLESIMSQGENRITVSKYIEGAIYQALREGRIVIIDEATFLDQSMLASLNRVLNLQEGDALDIQEDGKNGPESKKITRKEGFGIGFTGNIGPQYFEREKFDPAFRDRVPIREYPPLKQVTEGALTKEIPAEEKEIYMLLLLEVMDKNGNIFAPRNTLRKLWGLAQGAKVLQEYFASGEPVSIGNDKVHLTEMNLSIRGLQAIIRNWKNEGMAYELDYYVADYLINRTDVSAPQRAAFYNVLYPKGLFSSEGWPNASNTRIFAEIGRGRFKIKSPKNRAEEQVHLPVEEVVSSVYGRIPERTKYPDQQVKADQVEAARMMENIQITTDAERILKEMETKMQTLAEVIENGACPGGLNEEGEYVPEPSV